MKWLGVFCGGSTVSDRYNDIAIVLGGFLARHRIGLVYGGGSTGLMGLLAESVLRGGGHVHGVIPGNLLQVEKVHRGLTELTVATSMHDRKQRMYERSDAFLVLPGGIGTMDEFWEVLVWNKLAIHNKPIFLSNPDNYYSGLLIHLGRMKRQGFVKETELRGLTIESNFENILAAIERANVNAIGTATPPKFSEALNALNH